MARGKEEGDGKKGQIEILKGKKRGDFILKWNSPPMPGRLGKESQKNRGSGKIHQGENGEEGETLEKKKEGGAKEKHAFGVLSKEKITKSQWGETRLQNSKKLPLVKKNRSANHLMQKEPTSEDRGG